MGTLNLPLTGRVAVDANTLIYSAEHIQPYAQHLAPFWKAADIGQIEIFASELVLLECLVKPLEANDAGLEADYRELLLHGGSIELIPISTRILELAAEIRAATHLKAPDAIHAATAKLSGVDAFITNDAAYRRVHGLNVLLLSEL